MAKKTQKPKPSATLTLTGKDKKTLASIRNLADEVVQSADRGRAPYVEIPSRSLSNVRFNQSKRIQRHQTGIDHRTNTCRRALPRGIFWTETGSENFRLRIAVA